MLKVRRDPAVAEQDGTLEKVKERICAVHPDIELRFIDMVQGHGVRSRDFIPRHYHLGLRPVRPSLEPRARGGAAAGPAGNVEEYAYLDAEGSYVLCWDLGRYVNHGCEPTSRGVGPRFEIAVCDIEPGRQLTSDYAELNITASFVCGCGATVTRSIVRGGPAPPLAGLGRGGCRGTAFTGAAC